MIERFVNALPSALPTVQTVLDLGSYTGDQSLEFANAFPNARIFAFEARPQSAEAVPQAMSTFPNITVVEAAVHEFDGETIFHVVDEGNPGASSLFPSSHRQDVQVIHQRAVPVRALRLDTWAKHNGIDRFDLVWMDLQGGELLALRGMGDMLNTVRAMQLEVTYKELYQGQVMWPEVREFLESNSFRLVDEWPDVSGYFGDAVFVRNE